MRRQWLTGMLSVLSPTNESMGPAAIDLLERREQVQWLYAALERVPEKYRTVLALYEVDGLAGSEVADLLGVSVQTVWTRLHRGRTLLEKVLKGKAFRRQFAIEAGRMPENTK